METKLTCIQQINEIIPFSDLSWQWRNIEKKFLPEFYHLVSNGEFCLGPAVERFEHEFANYIGVKHAVGVNSGTSALHLALIVAGIKAGDKVLVPAQTFIATVWPLLYLGAIPILCDVERDTGNINIEDAEKRLEPGTKAIIPVHLYGQPANMKNILAFAATHHLKVIEDACQAHGAVYEKKKVGSLGLLGCYSFYPGKNLGAFGEAGIVVTEENEMAQRLRLLRHHGQRERYIHIETGFNYRMEGIQGLALVHKLAYLNEWTNLRRKIAKQYLAGLSDLPLGLPQIVHQDHVYHLFVIRTPQREQLRQWLNDHQIVTGLHYPIPLHRQPCLSHLSMNRDSFPGADEYSNQGLSLPIFAGMTEEQTERVIETIHQFFEKSI
jgi:dTDP-4-amino-4,6-dideoxygalactose transaminase